MKVWMLIWQLITDGHFVLLYQQIPFELLNPG